ncbi:MAG: aminomethyltransferase family protein [Deltaproteobacteria bacterium]|nr:aminomethyltransferase family protein [Deltaproteobacteria bacterium]
MDCSETVVTTRKSVALYPLPERGLLAVEGSDRVRWLNGMVTNDVRNLAINSERAGCHAMVLDRKGAIVADVTIWAKEDSLLLETDQAILGDLENHFRKFIIADDVQLISKTAELKRWSLEGPKSFELLAALLGEETTLTPWQGRDCSIADRKVSLLGFGFSGENGVQFLLEATEEAPVMDALRQAAEPLQFIEGDEKAREVLRVEAGRPALHTELMPKVFPQEARLEEAISTTKGCYIGQEITARLASRGHVNRLLVGLKLGESASLPANGTELFVDGKNVGKVTSSTHSPHVGAVALAMVRTEQTEPGQALQLGDGGSEVQVVALPFVVGGQARGADDNA